MMTTFPRLRSMTRNTGNRIALPLIAGVGALMAACTQVPDLPPVPRGEATQAVLPKTLPPYRFQVGDVLDLKFLLNPELNEQVTVRPDGMISTTVVQDLPVYGRTPAEVNADLRDRYKRLLKEPTVSVVVRSFAPTRVYVGGEVDEPGEFLTVGPNLTLTQAIARAGGIKTSGQSDKVIIIRRGADETPTVYVANFDKVTKGGDVAGDVRLAPYDVVFVPKTGVTEVHDAWQQYVQQFLPYSLSVTAPLTKNAIIQ